MYSHARRNHGSDCASCPGECFQEVDTERMSANSWRAKLDKMFEFRSGRVSATPDVENPQPTVQEARRRPSSDSTVDVPILYAPQFGTREIRINNEECPRVGSAPNIGTQSFNTSLRVPLSSSAVSGRSVRSAISQMIPNAENRFRTLFTVWDTRLSMKLFGSKNGIRKEEERRKNCKHFIIHPCSKFR